MTEQTSQDIEKQINSLHLKIVKIRVKIKLLELKLMERKLFEYLAK